VGLKPIIVDIKLDKTHYKVFKQVERLAFFIIYDIIILNRRYNIEKEQFK